METLKTLFVANLYYSKIPLSWVPMSFKVYESDGKQSQTHKILNNQRTFFSIEHGLIRATAGNYHLNFHYNYTHIHTQTYAAFPNLVPAEK